MINKILLYTVNTGALTGCATSVVETSDTKPHCDVRVSARLHSFVSYWQVSLAEFTTTSELILTLPDSSPSRKIASYSSGSSKYKQNVRRVLSSEITLRLLDLNQTSNSVCQLFPRDTQHSTCAPRPRHGCGDKHDANVPHGRQANKAREPIPGPRVPALVVTRRADQGGYAAFAA